MALAQEQERESRKNENISGALGYEFLAHPRRRFCPEGRVCTSGSGWEAARNYYSMQIKGQMLHNALSSTPQRGSVGSQRFTDTASYKTGKAAPQSCRDTSVCTALVTRAAAFGLKPAVLMRDVLVQEVSKILGKAQEEFSFLSSLRGPDQISCYSCPLWRVPDGLN